jgi:copper resistance protein D
MASGGELFTALGVASKLLLYVTSLLAAGFALAIASGVIDQTSARRWHVLAVGLAFFAVVTACLRMCLSALQLGDMTLLAMVWDIQQPSLKGLFAGTIVLATAFLLPFAIRRVVLGFGAVLLCTSFSQTGHTQALEAPALFSFLVAGHVTIAAFWFSAPIVLWPRSDQTDQNLHTATQRFGQVAAVVVPLLFVGGSILAWKIGGGYVGLTTTSYGATLAAKTLFASCALGLGALNKTAIARLLKSKPQVGRVALKTTLRIDVALFCAILVAISLATTMFGPNA